MDTLLLSRIQFGLTIGFHFLFPPLTIGLAWLLVILEWRGWKRGDEAYIRAGKFFAKVLGLTFAVGVATGIVMEFQFGTNWAEYSRFVGDIFGAPLAAEALFAFFLESTFLGLYLFGRHRISPALHWFSILMVSVGATLSAFWIIIANSWMQTPAGYVLQNNRAELTSFYEAVFNPSTLPRFFHTMIATIIAGAFLMAGISAYLLLKNKGTAVALRSLKLSLIVGLIASIAAIMPTGHIHAVQVAKTQPEKFAAMEGVLTTYESAPLTIFGIPSENPYAILHAVEIPGLLSLMTHGDINAPVIGFDDMLAKGYEMPSLIVTYSSFHLMVALGMLFVLVMGIGVLLVLIKKLEQVRWYLKILPWLIPLPLLACELGWIVAEMGRQPWVVYHVLKTADAYSFNVSAGEVLFSIILFSVIYVILGALYLFLLLRKVKAGPEEPSAKEVK